MSVLTVITRRAGAVALARLGYRVAHAREERLVVLCLEDSSPGRLQGDSKEAGEPAVIIPGDEIPGGTSDTVIEICGELEPGPHADELKFGDHEAGDAARDQTERLLPNPEVEVQWLRASNRLQAVLDLARAVGATFLVAAQHKPRSKEVPLARKLFTAAPCHTLLARLADAEQGTPERVGERILVPTAGGPHAAVALRLGERLASAGGGLMVPLYVASGVSEFAWEVGERKLKRAMAEAGVKDSRCVAPRVELAAEPFEAINKVAAEGFDLLLLGDSSAGSLRRRLFGTVPEHLLTGEGGLQVAVVRREWKLLHRLRRRLGRWLDLTIPQMARTERIALYDKLQSGSEWNFDFMTLILLSTAIAALGLLQDSAAVVIGAMLVAPLMTPILGSGLALVQGNSPLLKTSGQAIVFGYLLALLIGLAAGLLFPIPELTPQLAARGGPTLLDLGVAFLSGLAAAFCLSRPGLLAALPGVAIAAALVPPIATTGVCLALGELPTARGSALLFGTNVVAIILGAAFSFYASGVRGKRGTGSHQRWVTYAFLALLLGTVVLAFPLGTRLRSQLTGGVDFAIPRALPERVEQHLAGHPEISLLKITSRRDRGQRFLVIELAAPRPLPEELPLELARLAKGEVGQDIAVRVGTQLREDVR